VKQYRYRVGILQEPLYYGNLLFLDNSQIIDIQVFCYGWIGKEKCIGLDNIC